MGEADFIQYSPAWPRFLPILSLHLKGERAILRKTPVSRMNKGRN
jgi:hypothetical protein